MSDFADAISPWDGKTTSWLANVHDRFVGNSRYPDDLLDAICNVPNQRAATWLIKHHLEQGGVINTRALSDILSDQGVRAGILSDPHSHLHLLQIMPLIRGALPDLKAFDDTAWPDIVAAGQSSPHKFNRAWGWQGAFELLLTRHQLIAQKGVNKNALVRETGRFAKDVAKALEVETGSVAARLRHIAKELERLK